MAKSGVDYVRNATRTKKFPLGLIFGAFALMGMAPAAHAVENDADAGVVVPDEPDDEAFNPGVAPSVDENRDERAVFQAWNRLDPGLNATPGVSVPSRERTGVVSGRSGVVRV